MCGCTVVVCAWAGLKKDVLKQMPPKKELIVRVDLSRPQRILYRALLTRNYQVLCRQGTQTVRHPWPWADLPCSALPFPALPCPVLGPHTSQHAREPHASTPMRCLLKCSECPLSLCRRCP